VLVTDHHRPGERLPAAEAVVNPARNDGGYPFTGLAGVGVAFKLLSRLHASAGPPAEELNRHLDLVALGTVADVVPLVNENRILVRAGLAALERTRKPGLRSLLGRVGWTEGESLDASWIAYRLGPRLNSAGRMGSAEAALELLLTDDPAEGERLAGRLEEENERRRAADRRVAREAEARMEERYDPERDRALVLWGDGWPPGVVGIAASRVTERIHRPTALVAMDGATGRGSARSVDGFPLHEALAECSDLLERFGGHEKAAGFEIRRSRLEAFDRRFRELARERLGEEVPEPELAIDLDVSLDRVDLRLQRWLAHLGPHGEGRIRQGYCRNYLAKVKDVAETMDVSGPTFHQHLREAERKLLGTALGEQIE
jgi:single-stranded-DNA-specific exonuclease